MKGLSVKKQELEKLFDYVDGGLYWKIKPSNNVNVGDKAGSANDRGYLFVQINKKKYSLHRLVYAYHHGYMPLFVDHIDNNKANNRIDNLRAVTKSQNQQNRKCNANSATKFKNVCWNARQAKWQVQVCVNKKRVVSKVFDDFELATLVAAEARDKFHGVFARSF